MRGRGAGWRKERVRQVRKGGRNGEKVKGERRESTRGGKMQTETHTRGTPMVALGAWM